MAICKHKWKIGSLELKGKSYDRTCWKYICEKCKEIKREYAENDKYSN